MNTYGFELCADVNATKKLYRSLAMQWHPDRPGGTNEAMKAVNAAYERALQGHHGETTMGSDDKPHTYYYKATTEQAIVNIIDELIRLHMDAVMIDLVGTWVWVYGDTRPHKDALKAMGLHWHSKRGMWYWREYSYRRSMSGLSYAEIQALYGAESFENRQQQDDALAVA